MSRFIDIFMVALCVIGIAASLYMHDGKSLLWAALLLARIELLLVR